MVHTPHGDVDIARLQPGDEVLAADEAGKIFYSKVNKNHFNEVLLIFPAKMKEQIRSDQNFNKCDRLDPYIKARRLNELE